MGYFWTTLFLARTRWRDETPTATVSSRLTRVTRTLLTSHVVSPTTENGRTNPWHWTTAFRVLAKFHYTSFPIIFTFQSFIN